MHRRLKFSRREILATLLTTPLLAQQEKEPFTITDNVRLVLLDVDVRDTAGEYVRGLVKNDFKIFDSGRPAQIAQFSNVEAPVTVGLILDDSGSMRGNRPGVVLAGLAFAKASNPHDEFFVVNFNDQVIPGLPAQVPFTDEIAVLQRALYMGDPVGKTKLYDAIAYALRHLEEGHHEKRTLIVVSDGGDNASKVAQTEVIRLIEESRATIYTIGLLDSSEGELQPHVLRRFSSISGGEYFQPQKAEDVIGVLARIAKDIRSRYSIGFTPEAGEKVHRRHNIRVVATHGGTKLNVKTRSSMVSDTAMPTTTQYTKPGIHSFNRRRFTAPVEPERAHGLNVLIVVLALLGIGGLGYYAYVLTDQYIYQSYANWAFEQQIAGTTHHTFRDYVREKTPFAFLAGC